jgi:hypothetical protein
MVFAPDASIHAARLKKSLDKPLAALLWTEQSRPAEYDRLTALPRWARTFGEIVR